jgi:hypothetical protein
MIQKPEALSPVSLDMPFRSQDLILFIDPVNLPTRISAMICLDTMLMEEHLTIPIPGIAFMNVKAPYINRLAIRIIHNIYRIDIRFRTEDEQILRTLKSINIVSHGISQFFLLYLRRNPRILLHIQFKKVNIMSHTLFLRRIYIVTQPVPAIPLLILSTWLVL